MIELSRLRQQFEAVRAAVAELHAGMERDLLASMRLVRLSSQPLREVTVEKSTREPELVPSEARPARTELIPSNRTRIDGS